MTISVQDMERRIVRYGDLIPCNTAFIDARTPGSDKKENFTIIGPGVSENPGQHVHVKIPHGFNIGGARQPKGCVNSQHSHETAEVFLVHTGNWAFRWGETGDDGEVILGPGDVISIPVHVFRGFECVEGEDSFLFAILGGDDPGHVTWAPYVFEQAAEHGLVLTKAGRLIDTAIGEQVPDGDAPCAPTSAATAASLRRMTREEMSACVVSCSELRQAPAQTSFLSARSVGVEEYPVLGPANALEKIDAAKVANPHGFHFRKLVFKPNGVIPSHSRAEEDVVFVHRGAISLHWDAHHLILNEGDTATIPKAMVRRWRNAGTSDTELFVVRGGDTPGGPSWSEESPQHAGIRQREIAE